MPQLTRSIALSCIVATALALGGRPLHAQARDGLVNGTIIGAAVGAGAGVAFTHAVRDSDLTAGQYAYGALIFGAIGAGVGLGIDALLNRGLSPAAKRKVMITPACGPNAAGVVVKWRW